MTMMIGDRAPWLQDKNLQTLLAILSESGEEARVVGGAVRNALMGEPVHEVDIASTTLPEETVARAGKAGFKAVPTGIEHGTVTVVIDGTPYEVTTLRSDVETDGRHAKVKFSRDWEADARRRDFTINALYLDRKGQVHDHVGGAADIETRTLRFIGDPGERIEEDFLRILRFFRFFARYGSGRPDAEGLKACARLKSGLTRLSVERVWAELSKLLAAPDPSRAILWMRQTSVLTAILPESEKWGIDAFAGLIETERTLHSEPDILLRLMAIVPPDEARMVALARRLKMSKRDEKRLASWALTPSPTADLGRSGLAKMLYRGDPQALRDRIMLAYSSARSAAANDLSRVAEAGQRLEQVRMAQTWENPVFPVSGADLLEAGFVRGKPLGDVLKRLEERWIDSGFTLTKDDLLEEAYKDRK
ncbi:CCA tRNA nucleotidyltransferase [Limoniibacter endophyticus]|uniref:Cytidine(C)-cytidine(C)-adenosine (A)]-adding enzyme n=1 Tax=Limoniibacter endophyticus TaxID=1565040 RepID=A0A8J3DGU7_9HYPH|nr:CCA tRNA nucleotidyltransferase [Limoniibacter endophyticus]GHC65545.1 cytidine(C)-cytidine(C)-adenosine (A)]-adding enzyme [Limoniibacter endophyticus]